jgi:hypothetical protein
MIGYKPMKRISTFYLSLQLENTKLTILVCLLPVYSFTGIPVYYKI